MGRDGQRRPPGQAILEKDCALRKRILPPKVRKDNREGRASAFMRGPRILVLMAGALALGLASTTHSQEIPPDPDVVGVGLKVDQIASVNQKDKNFTVVATLRLDWKNPDLAFEPEPGEREYRTYRGPRFFDLLTQKGITWPALSMHNQQGRLAVHNELVYLTSDGNARYMRRFTGTFQAPDFDFTRFPFDVQHFKIKVDSIFGERRFLFRELPDTTGLSDELGAAEWVVTGVSSN